jgi:hypothetical protein
MMVATGLYEPENLGYSSNSSFLYVAAAERMAKVATMLGKTADAADFQQRANAVRMATEAHYWLPAQGFYDVCVLFGSLANAGKPFEDISLMPLRIGYAPPTDARMRTNLFTVMNMLETPDGFIQSKSLINGLECYDGMVPGYFLQDLALVDHPEAVRAFNALGKHPLCTGEVCEGHVAQTHDALMLEYATDGVSSGDIVARYRPWEGGLCVDGCLCYLFGESWDAANGRVAVTPHVPNGWGAFAARDLKFNGQTYDVEVRDFGNRRLERVTNHSGAPLTVDLGASVVGTAVGAVRIDGVVAAPAPIFDAEFGRIAFRVTRTLAPGAWVDLDFDYVP